MHKGIILLVKTNDKEEILSLVENFLKEYQDDVWDWYQVGGRWNNTLAPKEKLENFQKLCDTILTKTEQGWITQNEVNSKQSELQKAWEDCGLKGNNSYCDHYRLSDEGNVYDILPLKDCIETVKEWCKDLSKEKEKLWNKLLEAKKEAQEGKWDSTGYLAGQYRDAQYGNFCFESNVYNISTNESEIIPENIEDYYAVMIDIHN